MSKAGKPLTHRQWERNQKLKESGKGTQVVAGAPPGGGKRGVRKRRPIDFADRIEIAFRA